MRFFVVVLLTCSLAHAQLDTPAYDLSGNKLLELNSSSNINNKTLSKEEVNTFNEMKIEIKGIYEKLLKDEIKKNPKKSKELIKFYNNEYRNRILALGSAYRQGKINIVRKWKSPSLVGTIPSGYGAGWGHVFLGGALSNKTRFSKEKDWNLAGGFGLLNPGKWVGITLTGVIDSVSSVGSNNVVGNLRFKGKIFDRGGLNFKISRWLWQGICSIAASRDHVLHWGMDSESKHYLGSNDLSTSCIYTRSPINTFANTFIFTAGLGDRSYQTHHRWSNLRKNGIAFFGGVGMRMWRPFSIFLESRRYELNAGASYAPFPNFPWTLNIAVLNLTKKSADYRPIVFSGVVSHSF